MPHITQISGALNKSLDGSPLLDIASHSVSHSPNAALFGISPSPVSFAKGQNVRGAYYPQVLVSVNSL